MSKHRILIVTNDKMVTGITYYRQLIPHYHLIDTYKDFECVKCTDIDRLTDGELGKFDIVQFSRWPSHQGQTIRIIERCKKIGLKVVLDIDDWWKLDNFHLSKEVYKENYLPQQAEEAIRATDYITTTTEILAEKIRPLNSNVTILPNAIDPEQEQYKIKKIESGRLRFGWIGGVYHQQDILLLAESIKRLWRDRQLEGKWQIVLAGFNIIITEQNFKRGTIEFLKQIVREPYVQFEYLLTDRLKHMPKYYIDYLKSFNPQMEHISYNQSYRRVWSRDVLNYVRGYNEIDVCLVPLQDTEFNNCKSGLKLAEAGFMNKVAIVSDVEPYKQDIKPDNCLTVAPGRDHIDWYINIRKLILDKELREDLRDNLRQDMLQKYNINKIGKLRYEFYKKILKEK